MKLIFKEFQPNYDKYNFPYQVLAQPEYGDDIFKVYASGFLPFRSKKDLYYLARSTRIRLGSYQASSENRRILRKMEHITYTVQPLSQFEYTKEVQKFCANSAKVIGQGSQQKIPTAAIRKLMSGQSNVDHVITYRSQTDNIIQGYAAIYAHANFIHYAHPFPNPESEDKNLNIGMMTLAIEWAKEQYKQFIYLGTSYSPGSLYKTQFSGFEFYTGQSWSSDISQLKQIVNRTSQRWNEQEMFLPSDEQLQDLTSEFRVKQK